MSSSVLLLEIAHKRRECVHALFGERIVDRGSETAVRPVTLQAVESRCGRLLDEQRFQRFARQTERHVHE